MHLGTLVGVEGLAKYLALKEGSLFPEMWSGYSKDAFDILPLTMKRPSGGEVLCFRDRAFDVYFNSPRYLGLITRKFGVETARHVRERASHKLERKWSSHLLSIKDLVESV